MSKKVLITGISGFVGGYLAKALIDQGHQVFGIIRKRSDSLKPRLLNELGIYEDVTLIQSDIIELSNLLNALHYCQPDWIFHLAAQSFVPRSFSDPLGTFQSNCLGTQNLLEAIRLRDLNSKFVFAGSSEEYGLQFINESHFEDMKKKYGEQSLHPLPKEFPELPINENNILRPMSPYATSKVFGDFITRNYHMTYGLNTIVSRAFNHEGSGRGHDFVTSSIVRQVVSTHLKEQESINIGDVSVFRDWSHVYDIVNGYILLANKAESGSAYVQGSGRTHSVLTYILQTIELLGYEIKELVTLNGEKSIKDPLEISNNNKNKISFSNKVDDLLYHGIIRFKYKDQGFKVITDKRPFYINFDITRFRPSDVPILLSDTSKIQNLGYTSTKKLSDIISDQTNYYLDPKHRLNIIENKI